MIILTINFNKEVQKNKKNILEDLFSLLKIKSIRNDKKANSSAPFGPGPAKVLNKMLEIAKNDGFITKNLDNYVGYLEYGDGEEVLGIFTHLDVVPAENGWKTDPFTPTIRDNKLYARGVLDDKGPTIAAYYGLKILKKLKIPMNKKVRFVFGIDEESGWEDMEYYFKHAKIAKIDFGFSPDAEFPIINGEKGNITEYLNFGGSNSGKFTLHHFSGGVRENMVPESAKAIIHIKTLPSKFKKAFENFVKINTLEGEFNEKEDKIILNIIGKSAHGASPHLGVNAAVYLANFLKSYDFRGDALNFLKTAGEYLLEDHEGKKLQITYKDKKMGNLTMNAGIFQFEENSTNNKIALNFRYPKGITPEKIKDQIEKTLKNLIQAITLSESHHPPHYVPMNDPLVATLLETYENHTGKKGFEQVIGGGTFGRLLKRGVAYGAMFPHSKDTMHQANEFIDLADLFIACAIYADAIYRLTR